MIEKGGGGGPRKEISPFPGEGVQGMGAMIACLSEFGMRDRLASQAVRFQSLAGKNQGSSRNLPRCSIIALMVL
jgi:hypothetical protein